MPTSRQQQKVATARRIFAAAVGLFTAQGYEATTVDQIAQAAGVAKGTFFTHFPSKDAVLDHIGAVQMERIAAAIDADAAFAARGARGQLHLIVATLAAGLMSQPAEMRALTFEIMARRSLFDVDRQGISALDGLIERVVAAGQIAGTLRVDVPAARLATVARGSYFLAVFEWVGSPDLDLPTLAAQYLDVALDGMAAGERGGVVA